MSVETEAAAMAAKLGLEITGAVAKEVVKLGAEAAQEVAAILLAMLKSSRTKAAGRTATELLSQDGVTPVLATMTKEELTDFKKSARKLGIPFIVAKNRDGEWNVVTRGSDAGVTNEILNQIGYGQIEAPEAAPGDLAQGAETPQAPVAASALTQEDWRQLFEQAEREEGGDPSRGDFQELLDEVFPADERGAEMSAPPDSPEASDPNAEARAAEASWSARGSSNDAAAWSGSAANSTRAETDATERERAVAEPPENAPIAPAEAVRNAAPEDFPPDAGAKRQLAWGVKARAAADKELDRTVGKVAEMAARAVKKSVGEER
jgi:hypothetical protein